MLTCADESAVVASATNTAAQQLYRNKQAPPSSIGKHSTQFPATLFTSDLLNACLNNSLYPKIDTSLHQDILNQNQFFGHDEFDETKEGESNPNNENCSNLSTSGAFSSFNKKQNQKETSKGILKLIKVKGCEVSYYVR